MDMRKWQLEAKPRYSPMLDFKNRVPTEDTFGSQESWFTAIGADNWQLQVV